MSAWVCRGCTAVYAVDAPRCPQCGINDPIDELEQLRRENEMPKITVHGGPSNAVTGEGLTEPAEAETAAADEVEVATATEAETEQEPAEEKPKPRAAAKRKDASVTPAPATGSGKAGDLS